MTQGKAGRILAQALAAAAIGLAWPVAPAQAGAGPVDARLDPKEVLAASEAALGRTLGAHELIDSDGRVFTLDAYRGRPLVVSLVYTSCSSVCPTTTEHLARAVDDARRALGRDAFAVLTVGFDARRDTPKRLASFADAHGIDTAAWRVASGEEATVRALLSELGFSYAAAAGGFEHVSQTSIIDAEGRVYRHVYGDDFPVQVFVEPLKELVFGVVTRSLSVAGLIDRLRFLCTTYDPNLGRYRTSYAIGLGIGIGALSLIGTGGLIASAWRRNRRLEQRLARS